MLLCTHKTVLLMRTTSLGWHKTTTGLGLVWAQDPATPNALGSFSPFSSCARLHRGAGTHYETLQVSRSASPKEIKAAYFKLSKKYHPDMQASSSSSSDSHERFRAVSRAYEVLGKPKEKRIYDMELTHRNQTYKNPQAHHSHHQYYHHSPSSSGYGARDRSWDYQSEFGQGRHRDQAGLDAAQRVNRVTIVVTCLGLAAFVFMIQWARAQKLSELRRRQNHQLQMDILAAGYGDEEHAQKLKQIREEMAEISKNHTDEEKEFQHYMQALATLDKQR